MEVIKVEIEKSKMNPHMYISVLTVEDGAKFVMGGEDSYPVPYEQSWETDTIEGHKANNRFGLNL